MNAARALVAEIGVEDTRRLAAQFARAEPWPHVVIDDLLTDAGRQALRDFPSPEWPTWKAFADHHQKGKHVCPDVSAMPRAFADLIHQCGEPRFLAFLEAVTGIRGLLTDPYLDGGGLHASGPGGVLTPHTDFHLYPRLNLYRALNLLIYLNDDWTEADGGCLGLYRKGESAPAATILPAFGRAVLFRTDDHSVHGFTTPVAAGKWRKSVALYYYTARDGAAFAGDTSTHWKAIVPGMRGRLFDGLIFTSRAFSKLAHLVDPNSRQNTRERLS